MYLFQLQLSIFQNGSYEMVPELYMLSLRMEGPVLCNMNGTLDVTVQPSILLLLSQFLHKAM
jgi:hypothetical protein